jgi:hypothetical protein
MPAGEASVQPVLKVWFSDLKKKHTGESGCWSCSFVFQPVVHVTREIVDLRTYANFVMAVILDQSATSGTTMVSMEVVKSVFKPRKRKLIVCLCCIKLYDHL